MIKKLHQLNKALRELGQNGYTITKMADAQSHTRQEITAALNKAIGARYVDVCYEIQNPLELTYVIYQERVETEADRTVFDNGFATLSRRVTTEPRTVRWGADTGNIIVTEDFVDVALKDTLAKVKELFTKNIVEEMVKARLKERGLV